MLVALHKRSGKGNGTAARTLHYSGILSKHNARFHTGVKRSHLDEGVIGFSELTPHRPHVPEEFTPPRRRAEGLSGVGTEMILPYKIF